MTASLATGRIAPRIVHQSGVARCGFCATGNDEKCAGAVRNGVNAKSGGIFVCQCGCEYSGLRCLDCGHRTAEDIDPATWSCVDRDGCAARSRKRTEENPSIQLLREIQERYAMPKVTPLARKGATKTATPKTTAADKPVREKKECGCGCQTLTGGNFAPGHDARFVSGLVAQALKTKSEVSRARIRKQAAAYSDALAGKFDKSLAAQEERAAKAEQDAVSKPAKATARGKAAEKAAAEKPATRKRPARKAAQPAPEPEPEDLDDDADDDTDDDEGF